jgi:hypothetical protein
VGYLIECLDTKPEMALGLLDHNLHSPNMHIVRLGAEIMKDPDILRQAEWWQQNGSGP